jgi:two-component system, OmpR family, response regulator
MAHQILIVDDEASFADLFAEHLGSCGYTVSVALQGKQAIQRVSEVRPDLIFLDLKLPDMSGEELLERIRELSPQSKIVILTAYHAAEIQDRLATQPGVVDFIAKPIQSLRELEKKIAAYLKA